MDSNRVFYEIKSYLDYLEIDYKNKIPENLYKIIEKHANEYVLTNPENIIEPNDFINRKKLLSKGARAFLFKLDYDFFAESDEKIILLDLIKQNDKEAKAYNKNNKSTKDIQDKETLDQMYERVQLFNTLLNK